MRPATLLPRERLGALWLWAALTSTACGGIPVSACNALAHRGGQVGAGEDEVESPTIATVVSPSSSTSAWATQRIVDALGEAGAGGPAAVRAGRRAA